MGFSQAPWVARAKYGLSIMGKFCSIVIFNKWMAPTAVLSIMMLFSFSADACGPSQTKILDADYQSIFREKDFVAVSWEGGSELSSEGEDVHVVVKNGKIVFFQVTLFGASGGETRRAFFSDNGLVIGKSTRLLQALSLNIQPKDRVYLCADDKASVELYKSAASTRGYLIRKALALGVRIEGR